MKNFLSDVGLLMIFSVVTFTIKKIYDYLYYKKVEAEQETIETEELIHQEKLDHKLCGLKIIT